MNQARIMVIGLGQWGHNWIQDIQANDEYDLVAIVDHKQAILEAIGKKFKIDPAKHFNELEEALTAAQPDVALITVPPQFHFPVVEKCIKNRVNVLSEKPLANDINEAKDILELVKQHRVFFMISQDYRWQPPIQTLRKAIHDGLIGKVGYIVYRHFQNLQIGGWREEMQNVILEDMAIHHFDLLRYLTGEDCVDIIAQSLNPYWSWYQGGAITSVQLNFEPGIHVNYFGTWVTTGEEDSWPGEVRIEGEKGALSLRANGDVYLFAEDKKQKLDPVEMKHTGRQYSLHEMKRALDENTQPETSIFDNIKSYAMTRAAIQSVQDKRIVKLSEIYQAN